MPTNPLPAGTLLEITDIPAKDREPHISYAGNIYNIANESVSTKRSDRLVRIIRPEDRKLELTEEMVEAVNRFADTEVAYKDSGRAKTCAALVAAFAPVINPPAPAPKTCREKIEAKGKCDGTWGGQAIAILADAIDSLRAEVKALKGAKE